MSNRTVKGAQTVHGSDPQLLVEKIIRERIYECLYWKEECFGLNAETILDKAVELDHVGGTFGNQRPTAFLCLLLKLLQIQPSLPIVEEYINQEDFKYLRILALTYLRLVAPAVVVYSRLETFLVDRRKLRMRQANGSYSLTYLDEVVDQLLTQDRVFDIILPRLTKRDVLEENENLDPRPLFFTINGDQEEDKELSEGEDNVDNNAEDNVTEEYRDRESLSVEETNELRRKLGLKPLTT